MLRVRWRWLSQCCSECDGAGCEECLGEDEMSAVPAAPSTDEVELVGSRTREERDAEARTHAIDVEAESAKAAKTSKKSATATKSSPMPAKSSAKTEPAKPAKPAKSSPRAKTDGPAKRAGGRKRTLAEATNAPEPRQTRSRARASS